MDNNNLSREAILSKGSALRTRTVEAFGGTVLIRELTAVKAFELYNASTAKEGESNVQWVIASVVDPETLAQIFSQADVPALENLSYAEISKISKAALELNGFNAADIQKNSQASPNGVSATV